MNWWDRTRLGLIAGLTLFFLACEEPSEIGIELDPNQNNVGVFFTELTLPSSTVFIDSVVTSEGNLLRFGAYNDPVFGRTRATAYTQLNIEINQPQIVDSAEYGSMQMSLYFNNFHGKDFEGTQRIRIFQLEDTLFTGVFYRSINTTDLGFPIGEAEFTVDPENDSLITLQLDDLWGQSVFEILQENTVTTGSNVLRQEIKGIAIVPDENNSLILGFDPSDRRSTITLNYNFPESGESNITYPLIFAGSAGYSTYEIERSGSRLANASTPFAEFETGDELTYLQAASGIYPKLDLTPFQNLVDTVGSFVINRADIEIENLNFPNGENRFIVPPFDVQLLFTDETNRIDGLGIRQNPSESAVLSNSAYLANAVSPPLPVFYYSDSVHYTESIGVFLQLVADNRLELPQLLLYPSDEAAFGQVAFGPESVKLKIFYTSVNNSTQ